ncbi:MAG TPA: MBOAT family protein [Candidatus Eisenbergiella merdipullorum]|uniref:MBOAT family protein n=1 Tax=Candidatus Eisenbergiella merdipullorum TaxID=2838553 RepID=A0A9D2I7G4_9FIRM|nr:MBOAT family protein [Candidatus Eisenbergiella merdipullorum]
MSITSFYFLLFYACVLLIYYIVPKKGQWVILLLASILYYLFSDNGFLIFYPVAAVLACYVGIHRMVRVKEHADELKAQGRDPERMRRRALIGVIVVNVGALFLLKYINFGINTINGVSSLFGGSSELLKHLDWLAPLGISYYSLTLIGYVVDVYFEIAEPLKNPGKLALYGMFFPCMLSGPILRYREDGDQLYEPHPFNYVQVTRGMQRMLWGFFKVLVISERMGLIVDTVYGNAAQYPGLYIWIGTVAFAFQLYTNFSGGMDISLGIAQTLGLRLPENFERPFFSKTISEYWRRWHITLGVWMKDYVFYPILRSSLFTKLGKKLRARFGKKRGKQLTTFAGMFLLWFAVGIWHGGDWKYVIGSGLLHWAYIVCGELLGPVYAKGMAKLGIDPKAKWVDRLRVLRTFFLVNIGFVFFRADSTGAALSMLKEAVSVFNPGILIDGSIFTLGLDWIEFTIAVVSLLMLLAVSLMQEKGSVRERIGKKSLPVRWVIWYALLFYVILLGNYGPDYSAAEFIYQGF